MATRSPTSDQRRLWMGMARLVSHLSREASHAVQEGEGINLSEMTLMGQVGQLDGAARMVDLAGRLQLSKAAVTKIVASLEGQGYLERRPDPEDGRATLVSLTRHGASVVKRAGLVFEDSMRNGLWNRLDHGETQRIVEVLDRVQGELGLPGGPVMPP